MSYTKKAIVCMSVIGAVFTVGCEKTSAPTTPSSQPISITLEQEVISAAGDTIMSDFYCEPEQYQTTVRDDSCGITVKVDAMVYSPKLESVPIREVSQAAFTNNQINPIRQELVGNAPLYQGAFLSQYTKDTLALHIDILEKRLKGVIPTAYGEDMSDYEDKIAEDREKMKTAPDRAVSTVPSDGKLRTTAAWSEEYPENFFYNFMCGGGYSLDDEILWEVSTDGQYLSSCVSNSPLKSNRLVFSKGENAFISVTYLIQEYDETQIEADYEIPEYTEGSVTLSESDAILIANTFLRNTGLNNFVTMQCINETKTILADYVPFGSVPSWCIIHQNAYTIRYTRLVDGIPLIGGGEGKAQEFVLGEILAKRWWPQEIIEFRINDDGIVAFTYQSPVVISENNTDNAELLPFDIIKEKFEQSVASVCLPNSSYHVNRIEFGYSMQSETDNYNTGILIPVWNFYGTIENGGILGYKGGEALLMSIDAIDDTVVFPYIGE